MHRRFGRTYSDDAGRAYTEDGIEIVGCDLGDVHRVHALARQGIDAVVHCGAFSGPMVALESTNGMKGSCW